MSISKEELYNLLGINKDVSTNVKIKELQDLGVELTPEDVRIKIDPNYIGE